MGANPVGVIEEGTLRKHQSGQWIISNDEKDVSQRDRWMHKRTNHYKLREPDRRIVLTKKAPLIAGLFLLAQLDGLVLEAYNGWSSCASTDLFEINVLLIIADDPLTALMFA